ncbi:uncharacterized protein V6R79_023757 [Siganus canaliculatus]
MFQVKRPVGTCLISTVFQCNVDSSTSSERHMNMNIQSVDVLTVTRGPDPEERNHGNAPESDNKVSATKQEVVPNFTKHQTLANESATQWTGTYTSTFCEVTMDRGLEWSLA